MLDDYRWNPVAEEWECSDDGHWGTSRMMEEYGEEDGIRYLITNHPGVSIHEYGVPS